SGRRGHVDRRKASDRGRRSDRRAPRADDRRFDRDRGGTTRTKSPRQGEPWCPAVVAPPTGRTWAPRWAPRDAPPPPGGLPQLRDADADLVLSGAVLLDRL